MFLRSMQYKLNVVKTESVAAYSFWVFPEIVCGTLTSQELFISKDEILISLLTFLQIPS